MEVPFDRGPDPEARPGGLGCRATSRTRCSTAAWPTCARCRAPSSTRARCARSTTTGRPPRSRSAATPSCSSRRWPRPAICFDLRRGCSLVEHFVAPGDRRTSWSTARSPSGTATSAWSTGSRRSSRPRSARRRPTPADVPCTSSAGAWAASSRCSPPPTDPDLPIASLTVVGSPVDVSLVPLVAPLRPLLNLGAGRGPITRGYQALGGAPKPLVKWAFQLSSFQKLVTKPIAMATHLDDTEFLAQMEAVDRFTAGMIAYPGRTFGQLYHRFVKGNAARRRAPSTSATAPSRSPTSPRPCSSSPAPPTASPPSPRSRPSCPLLTGSRRGALRDRARRPPRHAHRPRRPHHHLAGHGRVDRPVVDRGDAPTRPTPPTRTPTARPRTATTPAIGTGRRRHRLRRLPRAAPPLTRPSPGTVTAIANGADPSPPGAGSADSGGRRRSCHRAVTLAARAAAAPRAGRLRLGLGGDRRVRHGAGADAAALPHRHPRRSRPWWPGSIVVLPKAWDVVLNPIAGRISDRTVDPRGPRRPWLLRAGHRAGGDVRAAVRRPRPGLAVARGRLGAGAVPGLRDGVRVLPGALRLDARRDDAVATTSAPG